MKEMTMLIWEVWLIIGCKYAWGMRYFVRWLCEEYASFNQGAVVETANTIFSAVENFSIQQPPGS